MPYLELNQENIKKFVHEFYSDIRNDDILGVVFDRAIGENWTPHLERMVDFWSTVMLGTKLFQGNVFGKHMLLNGIEPAHFQRWLTLFESNVQRLFDESIANEFSTTAHRIAKSLQLGFFGKVMVE
jgi:hemoglobin